MAPAGPAAQIVSSTGGRVVCNLLFTADDLLTLFSAGAKLYLDSASSEGGSYSNVTSTALVSGTEQITFSTLVPTTSTWHKVRVGNSGGTTYSDYSDPVQHTSALAYALPQDLYETMDMSGDTSRYNLLADLLIDASAEVDAATGRQFYRQPQVSGTETFYLDVTYSGRSSLVASVGHPYCSDGMALDIVSVTSISTRSSETGSYASAGTVDVDWFLDPGDGPGVAGTDWPWRDVSLSVSGSVITTWPVGKRAVKIVGARGFPYIPTAVKRATIELAREMYRQAPVGGAMESENDYASFGVRRRYPPSFWALTRSGSPYRLRSYVTV